MKIKKIQDILKMKEFLPKPRMKLEDFVGKNVAIVKVEPKTSKKYQKPGFMLQLKSGDQMYDVFTCAQYVVKQITEVVQRSSESGQFGDVILCKVDKVHNSLTLSDYDGECKAKGEYQDGCAEIQKD